MFSVITTWSTSHDHVISRLVRLAREFRTCGSPRAFGIRVYTCVTARASEQAHRLVIRWSGDIQILLYGHMWHWFAHSLTHSRTYSHRHFEGYKCIKKAGKTHYSGYWRTHHKSHITRPITSSSSLGNDIAYFYFQFKNLWPVKPLLIHWCWWH